MEVWLNTKFVFLSCCENYDFIVMLRIIEGKGSELSNNHKNLTIKSLKRKTLRKDIMRWRETNESRGK